MKKILPNRKIEPVNVENRLCPICKTYLQEVTDCSSLFGHKRCYSCGWAVDKNNTNPVLESCMKNGLSREEAIIYIRNNWKKIKEGG